MIGADEPPRLLLGREPYKASPHTGIADSQYSGLYGQYIAEAPRLRSTQKVHKKTLATNLRTLRARRGLSLAELAQATGISSSFLSLVEQAGSDITIGRLIRLADFYGVELADLLTGEHEVPRTHVRILKARPENMLHSAHERVDLYDLAAGARWTLVPMLGIHEPGSSVEVNGAHEREAMVFVLDGTFELSFPRDPAIRLARHEGAIFQSAGAYRFTNVSRRRGRVLAIGVSPQE